MTPSEAAAHSFSIKFKADGFEQTGDITSLIQSLQESYETGLPVDVRVLKFLNDSLTQWHESAGIKSLDEIMGLKPGRGARSVLLRDWEKDSKRKIGNDIALLMRLDFSLSRAAEITSLSLQAIYEAATPDEKLKMKPYKSGDKGDPEILFTQGTLMDYWRDNKDLHEQFYHHADKILSPLSKIERQQLKEQLISGK